MPHMLRVDIIEPEWRLVNRNEVEAVPAMREAPTVEMAYAEIIRKTFDEPLQNESERT